MDSTHEGSELGMEDRLNKIRHQINSKLENQKHVAIVLSAVEENLAGTSGKATSPVHYTVALISLLDQASDPETRAVTDLQLATSACYLLDISLRFTPTPLLRERFAELLTKVAPCITDENAEAPLIRAAIGCLEMLLINQHAQSWANTEDLNITPRRGLNGLLELSLDPRPKVRKRSQEAVYAVLAHAAPGSAAGRVISTTIVAFILKELSSGLQEASSFAKKKKQGLENDDLHARIMHTLRLTSTILSTGQWPTFQTEQLCDLLLEVTKSSDQYLVSATFECFENLFKSLADSSDTSDLAEGNSLKVLDIILSLKPSSTDIHLAGSWIAVIVKGMSAYAARKPLQSLLKVPELFRVMSHFLSSESPEVYISASHCLIAILSETISDKLLLYPPAVDGTTFEAVDETISELAEIFTEFLSVRYSHCARDILKVLAAAFRKLRYRANPDFIKPLEIVGEWRTNEESFLEFRNEAESVIGASIASMGTDVVLSCLPLNLDNPSVERPGRAWLLPLIRDNTRNTKLSTFIKVLAPISQLYESKFEALAKDSVQLKIFQTVVDQIWSTLPHFCELPTDLRTSFTSDFASDLSSMMYAKVESRTTICNALKVLVESNLLHVEGALAEDFMLQQQLPMSEAKKNLEWLSTMASNLLAVLFNVYTQTASNARAFILETIEAYLKVTSEVDLEKTFNNVCGLLKNAMDKDSSQAKGNKPQLTATLLDLVVCMSKYLPTTSYPALFTIFGSTVVSPDALIQKRAYRIVTRLAELPSGSDALSKFMPDIESIILDNSSTVQTASKSARLGAIKSLIELLPFDHMDFIVRIVAEVILSTKNVNEKSRDIGFECLIAMGKRMDEPNSVIRFSKIPGYEENAPDQISSVSEFFKVIAAGLIGESQHMVSSTIQAFACLIFEFRDIVEPAVLLDVYDTVALYLTSNSREIAKSAIGFAKVSVLSLPTELVRPKVPELLPKLLRWSHEHTGHFKAKVKHIIERLIRKFGYDYIASNFPQEDLRLLANIRKVKNRSKRGKGTDEQAGPTDGSTSNRGSRFMNAFDEALYDSSEEEDVSDEEKVNHKNKSKQFIMESKENPLDLLDSQTLAHISSTRPKKFNKADRRKHLDDEMFSFDAEGKLVMNDNRNSEEDPLKSVSSGIDAYVDAVKQGPVKGQRNRLKYKRNARAGAADSDDEDGDVLRLPKKTFDTKNRIGKGGKKGGKFKSRRRL
ncbi:ZYBA0S09-00694g1_1 [Zygosaccharomyces bailii CLIB 213]|uniref:ZYBA0S09-00694g1_1 n=1 Tax=Zygosaccharomyces bailii (strain CLIB 213 / ATCC 58445 / CBS 680 / BCRC 21525 / NBRC 1098 / NCYC 1416 / NRRL Y-2227) TaxID=1333698 RepID=A0A8J2TAI7_ZYGB2|nr:ZYBA0S09-00694g1_1 [Zygosaccharomyces bailii CLIB 213]